MKMISLFEEKQMTNVDELLSSDSIAFQEASVIKNQKNLMKKYRCVIVSD